MGCCSMSDRIVDITITTEDGTVYVFDCPMNDMDYDKKFLIKPAYEKDKVYYPERPDGYYVIVKQSFKDVKVSKDVQTT